MCFQSLLPKKASIDIGGEVRFPEVRLWELCFRHKLEIRNRTQRGYPSGHRGSGAATQGPLPAEIVRVSNLRKLLYMQQWTCKHLLNHSSRNRSFPIPDRMLQLKSTGPSEVQERVEVSDELDCLSSLSIISLPE